MLIVSYNIQYGLGSDNRYDLHRIADEIRDADIIALQEVDRFWERSGTVDAPQVLADVLGDRHWVFGANLDMDASFRDSLGALINRRRQFGTMILSRFPILSSRNFPLPKFGTVTQHSIQQGILEAVIDAGNGPLRFYSTHLSHLCAETRLPQVDAMLDIFARATAEGGAWCGGHPDPSAGWTEGEMPPMPEEMVLLGDMNFTAKSAEYARMIGPMTPYHGRLVNRTGLADAWVAAGHDESDGRTYERGERIDHCFLSPSLAPGVRRCWVDDQAKGSDHYPLWVELADRPQAPA